jgi:hypothetical protein
LLETGNCGSLSLKIRKGTKLSQRKPPPHYNQQALASQSESQDPDGGSSQELPEAQPKLPLSPQVTPHRLWPQLQVTVHPYQGSEGNSNNVRGIFRISPFPHHPKCSHQPFTYSERSHLQVETGFVDALRTSTEG